MSKTVVLTTRISEEANCDLDRLARVTDRSRAWLAAKAIEALVHHELELHAFVQAGVDDLENGRWISHEDLIAEIREQRLRRAA